MAARRLIALLIMLLVISSLAAALSPQPDRDETTSSDETTTTATATEAPDRDEVLREVVPAKPGKPGKPVRIEAAVGDQLQLEVEATGPTTVEISSLGLTGFATPGAPARFDLLLRAEGTNQVTLGAATTVARIRVSEGG